jgi:hypothetical protein
MERTTTDPEPNKHSLTGDSSKDSRDGSSDGDFPCPEALQRATGQNLGMTVTGETPKGEHLSLDRDDTGNLEVLTEKVGTLELRRKRNCSGAAKKRAGKARQAEAPTGDCLQPTPDSRQPDTDFAGAQYIWAPGQR